jgi:hypothetical protein
MLLLDLAVWSVYPYLAVSRSSRDLEVLDAAFNQNLFVVQPNDVGSPAAARRNPSTIILC